ncbi:MAG TPA: hypothetical protein VM123_21090 [archaeon]|nr:hypothetical protein [archaeon]
MPPEMKNILITIPFVIILVALFIWLFKTLLLGPSAAEFKRDKFEEAGYETIGLIRRKEYSVIGLGTGVIILCLLIMGFLSYRLFADGFPTDLSDLKMLNLILIFIPAIVLLVFIVSGSRHYIKHQQLTLNEFRRFKVLRNKAISEHQDKRSGKTTEEKKDKAPKGEVKKRERRIPTHLKEKKRRPKSTKH